MVAILNSFYPSSESRVGLGARARVTIQKLKDTSGYTHKYRNLVLPKNLTQRSTQQESSPDHHFYRQISQSLGRQTPHALAMTFSLASLHRDCLCSFYSFLLAVQCFADEVSY